jgi:hypothetical protein
MKKYQIVINNNQHWKLEYIKSITGLRMNKIVYLATIFQQKRFANGKPLFISINEEVVKLLVVVG